MICRTWTEIRGINMINKLPDTINAFTSSSKKTIQSLIREMKVDKTSLNSLIANLSNYKANADYAAVRVPQLSILDRQIFVELFRDSSLKINQFFTACNSVGLALNSMVDIFSSEISKVENDLTNLQLFIDNYDFFSGKDDLYNANYIEKFDDFSNDYRSEGFDFRVPDRDGVKFPLGGNGYVDKVSGVFKIGKNQITKNIINNIASCNIHSNYKNYITNTESVLGLFTETLQDSWSITIKSPAVLTSEISDYSRYIEYDTSLIKGAKTVLDMDFISPVNIDTIKFLPNLANGLQVLQVVLFTGNTTSSQGSVQNNATQYDSSLGKNYTCALNGPILLNDISEVTFPKCLVKKVIFIFNQSTYTRNKIKPVNSEINSKIMSNFINNRLSESRNRFSVMQDLVYHFFNRRNSIQGISSSQKNDFDHYSNKFPTDLNSYVKFIEREIFSANNFDLEDNKSLFSSNMIFDLAKTMLAGLDKTNSLIDITSYIEQKNNSNVNQSLSRPGFMPIKDTNDSLNVKYQYSSYAQGYGGITNAINTLLKDDISDSYEYNFSIKSIDFIETLNHSSSGNDQNTTNKACFVSKRIPIDGQILSLKAKVDLLNEESNLSINNILDLGKPFSYEMSISNENNPINESDWTAIAFNNSNQIDSEIVFFDLTDFSYSPRFKAKSSSVILYKDGRALNSSLYSFNYVTNKLYLTNANSYSASGMYVIRYDLDTLSTNPYELDFVAMNIYSDSTKRYYTSTAEGENFIKTNSNNSVKLSYNPYVNINYVNTAIYNKFNGTIFSQDTMGYSPVKIRLNDGSFAINLTNYTNTNEFASFFSVSNIYFIQSGKNIIFNRNITQPFTVYYDYTPNDLRFRLIMRKNLNNIISPAKADAVIIKIKTVTNDQYSAQLNKSTNTSQ